MIVISECNPFPAEHPRSGRVREIREILVDVLAAYDVAREEPPTARRPAPEAGAEAHREIISPPLESLPSPLQSPLHSGASWL
jgi:hypothetical protein